MMILLKNKPNTKPIQTQSKPILAQYQGWQSQTNPIQTLFWANIKGANFIGKNADDFIYM
jgi:hypothetical protein